MNAVAVQENVNTLRNVAARDSKELEFVINARITGSAIWTNIATMLLRLTKGDDIQVGFIAEETEEYFPVASLYRNDYKKGEEAANRDERIVLPAMLKLIQDSHNEIQELQNEIQELKAERS